ncbi:MAG TPA: TerC family protein [Myxococcota bacterium]|jgi:tellurite resistance protein TerC|nr:TerC family protein [Myxococcota bacterium]
MALGSLGFWIVFNAAVLVLLGIDLIVFNKRPHEVSAREAAIWSAVFVTLSLSFNAYIWWYGVRTGTGNTKALEFLTGYLIEYSLSVDNLFVFLVIFSYFRVPSNMQHRVLFWGILGALVFRGAFIFAGTALLNRFQWVMLLFGGLLIVTGGRMLFSGDDDSVEPEKNPVLRLLRRVLPTTTNYHGSKFTAMEAGRRVATPLLIVLVVIETTDIVFALDSIPAVFAISKDNFIVYTSNVCAILGLRALYFLLQNMMGKFRYLKPALALVLLFIGVKMVIEWDYFGVHIPIGVSLGVVGGMLAAGVAMSLLNPAPEAPSPGVAVGEQSDADAQKTAQAVAAAMVGAIDESLSDPAKPKDGDAKAEPRPPEETMDGDV